MTKIADAISDAKFDIMRPWYSICVLWSGRVSYTPIIMHRVSVCWVLVLIDFIQFLQVNFFSTIRRNKSTSSSKVDSRYFDNYNPPW